MSNTYKYKYKSPTEWEMGYEEVKLTKKEFKEIFGRRSGIRNKMVVFTREVENGRRWHCEVYTSKIGVVIALLVYPITVLMEGFANIKDVNKGYSGLFNQREKGTFYTITRKQKQKDRK